MADKVAEIGGQIRAMKAAKAEKDALKPLIGKNKSSTIVQNSYHY